MKKKRRRTAPARAVAGFVLERGPDSGPWDGAVNPERGNTCVRGFMRWYRQRLGLSLHQVEALTGIDRAYLRRLERRRIHLSLIVLWRWANGLQVNVDWVLKMARRQGLDRGETLAAVPALAGGSLGAPWANAGGGAKSPHATPEPYFQSRSAPEPETRHREPGRGAGAGAAEAFPEDLLSACLPEGGRDAPARRLPGLEYLFPQGMVLLQEADQGFLVPALLALVS